MQRKCEYANTHKQLQVEFISFRSTVLRIRKLFIRGTSDKCSLRSDWHAVVCFARPSQRYNISYPPPKMLPRIKKLSKCGNQQQFAFQRKLQLLALQASIIGVELRPLFDYSSVGGIVEKNLFLRSIDLELAGIIARCIVVSISEKKIWCHWNAIIYLRRWL